jgi:glyoxylate reductase
MNKPRIFVTQPIAESALQRLRAVADVEVNPDSSRVLPKEKLIQAVKRCDILISLLHDTVDRDVLTANPKLRAVSSMNITQDRIDLASATDLGIPVTNIPAIVTDATADIAFGLLLAVARNIVRGDTLVRQGIYPGSQSTHLAGSAVTGKTLGLVGFGRIGQAMARRGLGFDMKIIYSDPRRLQPQQEDRLYAGYRSLGNLLREADFVSLHPQLSPDTRHLMSDREFSLMKATAFVINTSRGPVIDEAALVRTLREKRIAGAGLDVYEHEPEVSPELLTMPNVVLTPHLGSAVLELREGMAHVVVDNTIALIEGREPVSCLNPHVLKMMSGA